ncbi:MAG: voltage-gated potassium channel [Roseibacillus sp.]|nr:voltage-gated potassium channel [Roseibacillus sp.]|tara:strand:+ start:2368 stop:3072 length:705 start_codon:yes stop_codon:yes gene_type:complete
MRITRDTNGYVELGRFEKLIQILIVISLISFAFETLPNLSTTWQTVLKFTEIIIVLIFTIEYIIRISLCRPRLKYIFSFYGVIDILAILPFFLTAGIDIKSIRAFRLLRLLRFVKLLKYNKAIRRLRDALIDAKDELILSGIVAGILLYLASIGIYYFEEEAQPDSFGSVFHSMWWAVCSLTTVGYGDVKPITVGGKIFTGIVLIIGVGIVAMPTAILASSFNNAKKKEKKNDL